MSKEIEKGEVVGAGETSSGADAEVHRYTGKFTDDEAAALPQDEALLAAQDGVLTEEQIKRRLEAAGGDSSLTKKQLLALAFTNTATAANMAESATAVAAVIADVPKPGTEAAIVWALVSTMQGGSGDPIVAAGIAKAIIGAPEEIQRVMLEAFLKAEVPADDVRSIVQAALRHEPIKGSGPIKEAENSADAGVTARGPDPTTGESAEGGPAAAGSGPIK